MDRVRLLVAIVAYNSANDIGGCLKSLHSERADLDIHVADNASTDDTLVQIVQSAASASVHKNSSNLGFARAVNLICTSLEDHAFILLANPDTVLQVGTIDALIELAERHPDAGLYGGRMLDGEGRLNPVSCLAKPSLWQAAAFGFGLHHLIGAARLDPDSLGAWNRTGVREVPVLTAGMVLIQADLWRRLGGFDESYFLYGEDVDLNIRARRLGARPMFTSDCVYTHHTGLSSRTKHDEASSILRGRASLYRRQLPAARGAIACALLRLGAGIRAIFERLSGSGETTWRAVWRDRKIWSHGWP